MGDMEPVFERQRFSQTTIRDAGKGVGGGIGAQKGAGTGPLPAGGTVCFGPGGWGKRLGGRTAPAPGKRARKPKGFALFFPSNQTRRFMGRAVGPGNEERRRGNPPAAFFDLF